MYLHNNYFLYFSNPYYLIEKPPRAPLKVYWNVPTKQCKSKKIAFEDLFKKYGIIQNSHDTFPGDKMSILYDPGLFPALLSNGHDDYAVRNGGVPQEGDLQLHLDEFKKRVDESIDKDFNGKTVFLYCRIYILLLKILIEIYLRYFDLDHFLFIYIMLMTIFQRIDERTFVIFI